MLASALADLVIIFHLGVIAFGICGALVAARCPRIAWIHVPTVLWMGWVELAGGVCPLTPLENWLRVMANSTAYDTSFVDHYILPVVYPGALTRRLQIGLGLSVLLLNLAMYAAVWWHRRARGA